MDRIIPVDVVMAGISYTEDIDLSEYKHKDKYHYKKITLPNKSAIIIYYFDNYKYLSVKASLPKIVYGTNSINMDLGHCITAVETINKALLQENIYLNYWDMKVSQMEISYNYISQRPEDKSKIIELCSTQNVSRKRKEKYSSSVVFKNKQSRTTIYDKSEEMKAHNSQRHYSDEKKVRVEHKLKKRKLKQYTKNLTVYHLLFETDLFEIFLSENKISKLDLKVLTKDKFYVLLRREIKHRPKYVQKRIIKFYHDWNTYDVEYIEEIYSDYQIKEYKKILESLGYNTKYIPKKVQIINFMKICKEERNERNNTMKIITEKFKMVGSKVKAKLSLCLRCTFFQSIFKYFDTS